MRATQWIEWTRTTLEPHEREDLLSALTSEQKAHLLENDYVWVKGAGVLWKATDGALRRARFTHGAFFRTQRGEFYIDSEGNAHERSDRRLDSPTLPPRAESLLDEPPGFETSEQRRIRQADSCGGMRKGQHVRSAAPCRYKPLAAPRGTP